MGRDQVPADAEVGFDHAAGLAPGGGSTIWWPLMVELTARGTSSVRVETTPSMRRKPTKKHGIKALAIYEMTHV